MISLSLARAQKLRCDLIFVGHCLVDNQTSEDTRTCLEGEYLCINHDVLVLRRVVDIQV
jgi:hypothetical protein